jgi:DNA (cytosine-5)-methyltransferase 1
VFLENVPGHLSLGFKEVYEDLCGLGYQVTAGLFSAEETGANHKRERLFILGLAHGVGEGVEKRASEHRDIESQRTPSQRRRDELGDAHSHGRQQITENAPGHEGKHEGRRTIDHYIPECAGQSMDKTDFRESTDSGKLADAEQPGSGTGINGKQGQATGKWWDRLTDYRHGLPLFAPARNDFRSWSVVARVAPTLMPAIESQLRGVADGLVSRSDRLRLVGNGVVPLAAAYAFLTLFACLGATAREEARRNQ